MFSSLLLSTLASVAEARNFTFDSASVALNGSLYQAAYIDGSVYATSSVGRIVNDSFLFKVDAKSLDVQKTVKLERDNQTNLVWAVYGIGADTVDKRVWVTNTRVKTVSVYDENLGLVKHLPANTTNAPRDVVVDQQNNNVYVSSSAGGDIDIYSRNSFEKTGSIQLATDSQPFVSVMELALDAENQLLYTCSLKSNVAAKVELSNNNKVTYYQLGNATQASAVALDNKRGHLYVASQGTDEILVVDVASDSKTTTSKVVKLPSSFAKRAAHDDVSSDIHAVNGSLFAIYEPKNDLVYVANRVHDDVYVIDAGTQEILTTIKTGKNPNHVTSDPNGDIWVVDKDTPTRLYRFTPRAVGNSSDSNSTPSGAASGSGSGRGGNGAAASGSASGGKGGSSASGSSPNVKNGAAPMFFGAAVAAVPVVALLL